MTVPTIRTPAVATGTGTNGAGVGAYNSSISVTKPTGTADGELLVAAILTDGSTLGVVQTLAGWTPHPANPLTMTLDGSRAYIFTKTASSEPSGWTFLSDLNNGNDYTTICVAVAGQAATWAVDTAHSTVNNSGNSSPVSVSDSGVTTSVADTLLLYFGFGDPGSANTGSWADPSGWTAGANSYSNYCPLILATKTQAVAGASGSAAATLTFLTGTCGYGAIIIPIAPVVATNQGPRVNPRRNRPGRGPYSRGRYFRPRLEHRGSPALSYTLIVADATHGHAVDNVSLSQASTLTVADAAHAHSVDAVALIQAHVLTLQDALHAHAVDSVSLTQAGTLAVADATHAHSVDALDLVQANVLAIQDALHAHAADSITLSQAGTLAVADATHGHTVDSVDLVQAHVLAVADALHAHAAEAPTLSTGDTLAVADALHAHAVDAVSLTQANVLVVQETSHGHSVDAVSLTQANVLAVADALHAHAVEAVTLSSGALLVVADATHGHTVDSPSLTQASALIVSDALHAHLVDALDLRMPHEPGDIVLFVVSAGDRMLIVAPSQRLYTVQ